MTKAAAGFARCIAASMACLCVACAGTASTDALPEGPGWVRTPTAESLAPQAAMAMVAIGSSTQSDVRAALGQAIVIAFDSGYQVWVYRWPGPDRTTRGATELVVLFDPSGLATKVRVRPGYAAPIALRGGPGAEGLSRESPARPASPVVRATPAIRGSTSPPG
jgi:hypothetical protein